jgi:hypothetical protein
MDLKKLINNAVVSAETTKGYLLTPKHASSPAKVPEIIPETTELVEKEPLSDVMVAQPTSKMLFKVPPAPPAQLGSIEDPNKMEGFDQIAEDGCHHLCDCNRWWSHGPKDKCRHPDILKQGKCPKCLNGEAPEDLTKNWVMKDGKIRPTGEHERFIRNREREIVKHMSIPQLTHHIEFFLQRIEELKMGMMETRKVRTEREDEETANLTTDSEREAFIQALRRGEKIEKKKTPKVKKISKAEQIQNLVAKIRLNDPSKSPDQAKLIATWMLESGKSQQEVEAFLND